MNGFFLLVFLVVYHPAGESAKIARDAGELPVFSAAHTYKTKDECEAQLQDWRVRAFEFGDRVLIGRCEEFGQS